MPCMPTQTGCHDSAFLIPSDMRLRLVFLLLVTAVPSFSQTIRGVVFADANGNGVRDKSESGIGGVALSDQKSVITTAADGTFQLDAKGFGYVMISIPNGYQSSTKPWKKIDAAQTTYDFALKSAPAATEFSFIHASDTHTSEKSVDRMEKLRALVEKQKPDFVLITGDLVRDALRVPEEEATKYYSLYQEQSKKISAPVWSVPGNHEIFGIERHLSLVSPKHPLYGKNMYRSFLGPNYYSFNYGGIHFVALDDVDFEDTWYFGHIDAVQLEWLRQDLAAVPDATPVVTFKHIPFFSGGLSMTTFTESGPARTLERENDVLQFRHTVSNAHDVVELITAKHPYPISLSGHYHARQTFEYESIGQHVRFEQTAAVVGPNEEGKVQFPSGVTLYKVKAGAISKGEFIPLD